MRRECTAAPCAPACDHVTQNSSLAELQVAAAPLCQSASDVITISSPTSAPVPSTRRARMSSPGTACHTTRNSWEVSEYASAGGISWYDCTPLLTAKSDEPRS